MKNMDKKKLYILIGCGVALIAAAVILIIVLTGNTSLEGKWKVTEVSGSGAGITDIKDTLDTYKDSSLYIILKDGKITVETVISGRTFTTDFGTYTKDNGKLKIAPYGFELEYEISGKKMTVTADGGSMKLEKE